MHKNLHKIDNESYMVDIVDIQLKSIGKIHYTNLELLSLKLILLI